MGLLQKTFKNTNLEELDNDVNTFGETHMVSASQSYCSVLNNVITHYRSLFYIKPKIKTDELEGL